MLLLLGLIYAATLVINNQPVPEVIYHFAVLVGILNSLSFLYFISYYLRKISLKGVVNYRTILYNCLATIVTIMGAYILVHACGSTWFEVNIDKFALGLLLILFGSIYETRYFK